MEEAIRRRVIEFELAQLRAWTSGTFFSEIVRLLSLSVFTITPSTSLPFFHPI